MHDGKKSAAELRAELRELRKDAVKPVSKMRIGDVSAEIEKLKKGREETPLPAATPSSAGKKKMMSAVESVKEAKMMEFPQTPAASMKKSSTAAGKSSAADAKKPAGGDAKKKSKLQRLKEMMEQMSDTEED